MRLLLLLAVLLPCVSNAQVILKIPKVNQRAVEETKIAVLLAQSTSGELEVNLDGEGGSVGYGYQIAEGLRLSKGLKITCTIHKQAYSMDAWLMEMIPCHRTIDEGAVMVLHKPTVSPKDRKGDGKSDEYYDQIEKDSLVWLCTYTAGATEGKITLDECQNHLNKALLGLWVFGDKKAKENGLVNEIIPTSSHGAPAK